MLADIDKETVDFRENYDNTRSEPTVLPAKLPNLLLNGQLGIAVGFIQTLFTGVVVALSLAFGLSFGLGGQEAASRYIEKLRQEIADHHHN